MAERHEESLLRQLRGSVPRGPTAHSHRRDRIRLGKRGMAVLRAGSCARAIEDRVPVVALARQRRLPLIDALNPC